MGSAGPDESLQKAVEPELFDVGKRLLRHSSSTDELLILLEKAESLLAKVWQQPLKSTSRALLPLMKALITDQILHQDDINVQVALASCFSELTRISAPDFTYGDAKMRVVFRLFMVAFEQLSRESGHNYLRAMQIVETMAKVRSFLMLLDVDRDGLDVKIFRIFLKNIRSNHPSDLFEYMEMIMTQIIEESDEISLELLRPLLASVKMHNKETKPMSWDLGKKVLENCATKLPCYLREAVKAMGLELDDYAEIVASIFHDTSTYKYAGSKSVSPARGELPKVMRGNCTPQTNDGTGTDLDDEDPMEASKGSLRKRRGRKPNSVIRPEVGYEDTRKRGSHSHEASPDCYNEEKEDMMLPSDLGNSSVLSNSSQKKVDSFNQGSLHKKGQSKKKESMINQPKDLEFSSSLKKKILKPKERVDNALKTSGKRATAGSSNIRIKKEEGKPYGRKESISQKNEREDDAYKMEDFPMSKPAKARSQKKEKEKKKRSWVDYGEELVSLRIQVWWPIDKVYYAGTVKAFHPETKKHTILYDDDETEILNLRKETWELLRDEQPPQKQEADHSSPPREPVKTKNVKRKASSMKKQHSASLSKRSKDEKRSISKSGEISSPASAHHVDGARDMKSEHILEDAKNS